MIRRRVLWSRDALDELKETAAYLASENPAAAKRVAAAIRKCGGALGQAATGRPGRVTNTYEKPVPGRPYILAYTFGAAIDGGEAVVILRVIHGARDWPDEGWPS